MRPPPCGFNVAFVLKEFVSSFGFTCFIKVQNRIKGHFLRLAGRSDSVFASAGLKTPQMMQFRASVMKQNRLSGPSRGRISVPTVSN